MIQTILDTIAALGPTQTINVIFTIGGVLASIYLLSWQIRLRPRDRQSMAALMLIATLGAILAQLAWSNLGGLPMRDSLRGNISYLLVMTSLVWLAIETRNINRKIIKQREQRDREYQARMAALEARDTAADIRDSVADTRDDEADQREEAIVIREDEATDREYVATDREGNVAGREGTVTTREVAATDRETGNGR